MFEEARRFRPTRTRQPRHHPEELATISSNRQLAFAHLNLRRNPFGHIEPDQWAELAVVDLRDFVQRLQTPGFVVQFIGEQGRGKSTHMRALHAHFPKAPYLYFGPGEYKVIPHAPQLFLDETQRIPWPQRELLFRRKDCSFAIATHLDHRRQLRRCGLDVAHVEVEGLDLQRLRAILIRRIEAARRNDGPLPQISEDSLVALLEEHGDNLRAIEARLYETFQDLEEIGLVEV